MIKRFLLVAVIIGMLFALGFSTSPLHNIKSNDSFQQKYSVLTLPVQKTSNIVVPQNIQPEEKNNYKLYVVNEAGNRTSGYVSVVNGSNGQILKNITVGYFPTVIDPGRNNSFLYVSDTAFSAVGKVSVINTFSMNVVSNITGLYEPSFMAFTPNGSYIYIASYNTSVVYIASTHTDSVVGEIMLDNIPCGIAMAHNGSLVYVANGNNVSVISTITNHIKFNMTGFKHPAGIALTPNGTEMLVANFDPPESDSILPVTSGISIINLSSGRIIRNVTTGKLPNQIAISSNGSIAYVTDSESNNVSVVCIQKGSVLTNISVQAYPEEVVLSPDSPFAYVSDKNSNNVSVIDTATMTVEENITGFNMPWGIYFLKVPVGYNVTFNETGLPLNSSWSAEMNGKIIESRNSTINFQEENGTYSYIICREPGYYAIPSSGDVSVNGHGVIVNVTFIAVKYNVNFFERGLPLNTAWHVTLNGIKKNSINSTISFSEPNGSYPYETGTIPGYRDSNVSGIITVNASALTVNITFTLIKYRVFFNETGLPLNHIWGVDLNGNVMNSSSDSIMFKEPNGTYPFHTQQIAGFIGTPFSGNVIVNGSSVSINVSFVQVKYSLTFNETGLPPGSMWYAQVNGEVINSSAPYISFSEPNGTYSFRTGAIPGYASSRPSGTITINGSSANVSITFTQIKYTVTFNESGLPSGVAWYVNISNVINSGPITSSSYSLQLPNESYSFVSSTSDHLFTPLYRNGFTVNGSNMNVNVTFSLVTYKVVFSETDLKSGAKWYVNISLTNRSSALPGAITQVNVSSSMSYITVNLTNGTYSYDATIHGYRSIHSALTVKGIGTEVVITFKKITSVLVLALVYGLSAAAVIGVIAAILLVFRKK